MAWQMLVLIHQAQVDDHVPAFQQTRAGVCCPDLLLQSQEKCGSAVRGQSRGRHEDLYGIGHQAC